MAAHGEAVIGEGRSDECVGARQRLLETCARAVRLFQNNVIFLLKFITSICFIQIKIAFNKRSIT